MVGQKPAEPVTCPQGQRRRGELALSWRGLAEFEPSYRAAALLALPSL